MRDADFITSVYFKHAVNHTSTQIKHSLRQVTMICQTKHVIVLESG